MLVGLMIQIQHCKLRLTLECYFTLLSLDLCCLKLETPNIQFAAERIVIYFKRASSVVRLMKLTEIDNNASA